MKVAILGNQARAMVNFWSPLIRALLENGHEPLCLVPVPEPEDDPAWEDRLQTLGGRLAHYPLDRKGLNPFNDLRTLAGLRRIFSRERPDRLFSYTIKPVIYGALASAWAGYPAREHRHAMVTGLGFMFEADSPGKRALMQLARGLYHLAFKSTGTVWFQNNEDKKTFEDLSIIPSGTAARLGTGTGVDLERFTFQPEPAGEPTFLYLGRLLEAKGLRDLAVAAELLKTTHPGLRIKLLGPEEKGPGAIPRSELDDWIGRGLVEWLGSTHDVFPYLCSAHVIVLPSWREGNPTSLQEAMAVGRAIVATDVPGCREAVKNGKNGLLVPVRDARALAAAMEDLLMNPDLRQRLGHEGRSICEDSFDARKIAHSMLANMGIPFRG